MIINIFLILHKNTNYMNYLFFILTSADFLILAIAYTFIILSLKASFYFYIQVQLFYIFVIDPEFILLLFIWWKFYIV